MVNHFDKYEWKATCLPKLRFYDVLGKVKGRHCNVIWANFASLSDPQKLGVSVATIKRHVQKLVGDGYLLSIPFHGRGGQRKILIATFPELDEIEALKYGAETLRMMPKSNHNIADSIDVEISKRIEKSNSPKQGATAQNEPLLPKEQQLKMSPSTAQNEPLLPPCPIIEYKLELFLGRQPEEKSDEYEEKNLTSGDGGIELSEAEEEAFKTWREERTLNVKTKKAAYKSRAKKRACKIEALLLRLNATLSQKQIDELVRVWSVYKPELALPHLEHKLKRFNAGTWTRPALFKLWKDDGLIWHDGDRSRYRDECFRAHDAESFALVKADRAKPQRKFKKKAPEWKPEPTLKTWKVSLTFDTADEFQELEEVHLVEGFTNLDAITTARRWHDRTPINTTATEIR